MADLAASLLGAVPAFALAALRVATAFVTMPAPFGSVAPMRIRTAVSVAVTVCVYAVAPEPATAVTLQALPLLRAAVTELWVGAVIGVTVRVTLAAADVAGSIAGQSMALGFATSVDPSHGETIVPTTHLLSLLSTLIFFAIQGHHAVIAALATSFTSVPIGGALHAAAQLGVVTLGADLLARGLQIASPVVATMFIVQLATALVARAAPRVHLFAFSFSVIVSAGVLVLWVAAPQLAVAVAAQAQRLPAELGALVGGG